jgi:arsenate reductase-like glutaredoxin family protein
LNLEIWGYIFGGATIFGLIVGIFAIYNGRMTRREIGKLIEEESKATRELIEEESKATRELIKEESIGIREILHRIVTILHRIETLFERFLPQNKK